MTLDDGLVRVEVMMETHRFEILCLTMLCLAPAAVTAEPYVAEPFEDTVVLTGLESPTAVRFAADGRVFVAEKSGVIKLFDSLDDFNRRCIWTLFAGAGGVPDPASVTTLVAEAGGPVDLTIGPGGDLFYVGFLDGAVHRLGLATDYVFADGFETGDLSAWSAAVP